jgi:hypothetical protein
MLLILMFTSAFIVFNLLNIHIFYNYKLWEIFFSHSGKYEGKSSIM